MHLPVWIFSYRPVLSSICLYRMVNVTWYPFTSIVLPVPYPFTGMVYPVTARRSRHFFSTGIYFITSTVSICRYGIILPILYPVTGMVFRCRPVFSSITFCCLLMLPGIHLAVVYLLLFIYRHGIHLPVRHSVSVRRPRIFFCNVFWMLPSIQLITGIAFIYRYVRYLIHQPAFSPIYFRRILSVSWHPCTGIPGTVVVAVSRPVLSTQSDRCSIPPTAVQLMI